MRSTGEVMGVAETFARAFGKSMLACGVSVSPASTKKRVFVSVKDADKPLACVLARRLRALGYEILATKGTAAALERARVPVERVQKVQEGSPHIVDAIREGRVALVVNTTVGAESVRDSYSLRRHALLGNVPYFTTMAAGIATVDALEASRAGAPTVKSLQEWAGQ
jgi:carbamoyl-phosphate synthase large subunit